MTATVSRRDISVVEEVGESESFTFLPPRYWVATLDGRLSTTEHVDMARQGSTFQDAMDNLAAAIAEQGWEIR